MSPKSWEVSLGKSIWVGVAGGAGREARARETGMAGRRRGHRGRQEQHPEGCRHLGHLDPSRARKALERGVQ